MNHTKNYSLPQWELNDLIRMEDFNAMNTNIEAGIDGAKAEAIEAKSIANFAKATATAAQNKANELPYVTGSYVGTGKNVDINLGFRPSFVIICGHLTGDALNTDTRMTIAFGATGGTVITSRIALTDTGFQLRDRSGAGIYPDFTINGRRYDYIAFK